MTTGTATHDSLSPDDSQNQNPKSSKRLKRNDQKQQQLDLGEEKKEETSGKISGQKYSEIKDYKSISEQVENMQSAMEVSDLPYRNRA